MGSPVGCRKLSLAVQPHREGPVTAELQPRTRFRRAIEGRWVFHAELAAREAGNLSLAEARDLVCLYAEAEPGKFDRAAIRQATSSFSRFLRWRGQPASRCKET
jgi:hypothetical protein